MFLGNDPGVRQVFARHHALNVTSNNPRATSVFSYQGVPGFDPDVTRATRSGVTEAEPGLTLVPPSGNPAATGPCLHRVARATRQPL